MRGPALVNGGRLTDWLDVDGALAAPAAVLFLLVRVALAVVEVVVGCGAGDAGGVEEDFAAVLGLYEAEAAVANETDDGALHLVSSLLPDASWKRRTGVHGIQRTRRATRAAT